MFVQDFQTAWDFPCVGCIEDKHIHFKRPINSASVLCNYRSFFYVHLQGHVDAENKFITLHIVARGWQNYRIQMCTVI
jgi:hypothetical protein